MYMLCLAYILKSLIVWSAVPVPAAKHLLNLLRASRSDQSHQIIYRDFPANALVLRFFWTPFPPFISFPSTTQIQDTESLQKSSFTRCRLPHNSCGIALQFQYLVVFLQFQYLAVLMQFHDLFLEHYLHLHHISAKFKRNQFVLCDPKFPLSNYHHDQGILLPFVNLKKST